MPKLALNLAPPPIYCTSSGDTAAAAEGQLSDDLSMSNQSSMPFGGASPSGPSAPPSRQASQPAPAPAPKPKMPFAMPKLALNLAPPPIYYTSSGDTAAAAEGQLGEDLSLFKQQSEPVTASPFGSMSPVRGKSVQPAPAASAAAPAAAKPKMPFAMPKLALNLAPPPIYYTSSGDTAAAAEGQLSTEASEFGKAQPARATPSPQPSASSVPIPPPIQISKLALGGLGRGNAAASGKKGGIAQRSPRVVSMVEDGPSGNQLASATSNSSSSPVGGAAAAEAPSPTRMKLPLIPILKTASQQDATNSTPTSASARGDAPASARKAFALPLNMKRLQIAPHPHVVDAESEHSDGDDGDGTGVSARGAGGGFGDFFGGGGGGGGGAASPRLAPGLGDLAKEEKASFQGFVAGEALNSEEDTLAALLGTNVSGGYGSVGGGPHSARGNHGTSVFFPSALVSDSARRFGGGGIASSVASPSGGGLSSVTVASQQQYAPLEQVRRVSLIGTLITDDGPNFRSGGTGNVASPFAHGGGASNASTYGGVVPSAAGPVAAPRALQRQPSASNAAGFGFGGYGGAQQQPQYPRASAVVAGEHIAPPGSTAAANPASPPPFFARPYRGPFGFARTDSISGGSSYGGAGSTFGGAAGPRGICGSFVADRGTFPQQLLADTAAFSRHHRRAGRPIYASLHVHAQLLYLLISLLLRGLTGTSNPIIHPSANITGHKPSRRGPQHHAMAAASRNNATCGTLDERYSAAFSNLINNPANSAGVAVGGMGGGQNVLHPLHKHINHPLNQPAVRHLQALIQSENLNQGLTVLVRLLTACGQSEGIDGLPAPVLGRFYMGLDSSNQGNTASGATGASFVGGALVPYTSSAANANGNGGLMSSGESHRRPASGSSPNASPNANGAVAEPPALLLTAPPLSALHAHSGTSTVVNIPMGAKMIGKGGYGTVLASNVAVVYSTPNDALPNPAAAPLTAEQQSDQAMFHRFVGAYLFGDSTNNVATINARPVVKTSGAFSGGLAPASDTGRHGMSFPITPSTTVTDPATGETKTPSIVSLPVAVKLIAVPTFAEDRCALFSLHSEVLIMLRAQDGGRYRTGSVLNAPLVGNPSPNNCSELLDFGCSGNQYYVVMKRYPTSVKDWRERLVWDSTHLVKGRRANLNIEVSDSLVEREMEEQQRAAAVAAAAARRSQQQQSAAAARARAAAAASSNVVDCLNATSGTLSPNDSDAGNVSSADDDGYPTHTVSDDAPSSSSDESFDSDDSFAETKSQRKRREARREKERLAETIKDKLFDTHKKVSDDVLWLAAAPPPERNNSATSAATAPFGTDAATEQRQQSSSFKPAASAIPEVKNPVLATMFPVLAHLFIQMLDTILALHQRSSTIHYDIKCDNFFLDFSDCVDRGTEPFVMEALAAAGSGVGASSPLFAAVSAAAADAAGSGASSPADPAVAAARERLDRLNGWAEEALAMAAVPGADGTLPTANMVKVRLGDFGESYVNSKFAIRQTVNAQTQKARLERYWRLLEEQKRAIHKLRKSVALGKSELSTDDDSDADCPTRGGRGGADDGDLSDDLTDHFISNAHATLTTAITNAAARGEFVADDDCYESASDEGGAGDAAVEDRRHSSDPETDPDDIMVAPPGVDPFEMATKRSNSIFVNQTPVPMLGMGMGFRQDMNPYARRVSLQPNNGGGGMPPMSARSGSGNRSSHDGAMSARVGYRGHMGDSPTIQTPTSHPSNTNMSGGLPPAMHLRLNANARSSPINNRNTPVSARMHHSTAGPAANARRGGPMILQLALAQSARNNHNASTAGGNNNNNNTGSSIPNSARYGPAPSARYGYGQMALPSARGGGGAAATKASAASKLDKRYARGTEIIRPPELLLPHKFLADRRRRTHRTGYESDIWAVGCLLYELLTGDFLFYENLFPKMLARVTNHEEPLMEDSHREMLNNDTDIINFLHFVLTRDPQRRPLLTEVRRRFVLLAQKKLSQQFSAVRRHLRAANPTASDAHVARLAGALGFSAKIPTALTKDMMLPVECRRNVLNWTLEHFDDAERAARAAAAAAAASHPHRSASQPRLRSGMLSALDNGPSALGSSNGSASPSPVRAARGPELSSAASPAAPNGSTSTAATMAPPPALPPLAVPQLSSMLSPMSTAAPSLSMTASPEQQQQAGSSSVAAAPPAAGSQPKRPSLPSLSLAVALANSNSTSAPAAASASTAASPSKSDAPQALRTFHTFVLHSLITAEALPLYKAWRAALVAGRQGLTGVCLPIAESDGSNSIAAVAKGHAAYVAANAAAQSGAMTSRSRASANSQNFYLNAAAAHLAANAGTSSTNDGNGTSSATAAAEALLEHDPLLSDEAVEAVLESAQGYGLAATVSAQRVNGYKRDAMVGARGWDAIEREKVIAAAAAEYAFGVNATASPLNNVISAASVADALYGASPIVNVTNLISVLANSYLLLGLETDDADAAIPESGPVAEDPSFFAEDGIGGDTPHQVDPFGDDINSDDEAGGGLFGGSRFFSGGGDGDSSDGSLANSVVSELQDNARTGHFNLTTHGIASASPRRFVFPPTASGACGVSNTSGLGGAGVGGPQSQSQQPRTRLTPEMISALHSTKYASSAASSVSVRTLQQHGITHVLSFGPLPGVAKHFHYLDMSTVLSRYEAEVAAIKASVAAGTFDAMMQAYTQQVNNGSKSARGAPSPFAGGLGVGANDGSRSARGPNPSALFGVVGPNASRDEQIAHRLRPLHNNFVSWMVHGSSRSFCEHAASICGRVLVVPMVIMPTAVPRWVPMPLNIACVPDPAAGEAAGGGRGDTCPLYGTATVPHTAAAGGAPLSNASQVFSSGRCGTQQCGAAATAGGGSPIGGRAGAKTSPATAALNTAAGVSSPSPIRTGGSAAAFGSSKRLSTNSNAAAAAAAAAAAPTHSVDLTLVWLLIYLTQTHRLPVITAMAHISNMCPIFFQPHPQHRYLADGPTDAYAARLVNGQGISTAATVAAATAFALSGGLGSPTAAGTASPPPQPSAGSPMARSGGGGRTTMPFVLDPTDANANNNNSNANTSGGVAPQLCFVRAAAPVVIDVVQCVQAAVSILELYRMLTPAEFAHLGIATPPPSYQLMCGPCELPSPGCATPFFGALGGNQSLRDRTALLMGLAFRDMYSAFERKAKGLVKNYMSHATPSLKASLPYNDAPALWQLIVAFVAKHVMNADGTASAPRPMKPCPDDPNISKEERRRINKAAALYAPISLKLKMQWHRCLCAATLYPSVEIAPAQSFFSEGRSPLFASEHSVATQKLVMFDRNPCPNPIAGFVNNNSAAASSTTSAQKGASSNATAQQQQQQRRAAGPKARHHANLTRHARWLVNEAILPFAAKTRYVHGEVAVRSIFPAAPTAACALAPQSNLLRCANYVGGPAAISSPYSVKLTPSPAPESTQWQPITRKPSAAASAASSSVIPAAIIGGDAKSSDAKPFSPAFTILVSAMEGYLQQESIAARRRDAERCRTGAAQRYQSQRLAAGSGSDIVVAHDARGSAYHAFGSGSTSAAAAAAPSPGISPSPVRGFASASASATTSAAPHRRTQSSQQLADASGSNAPDFFAPATTEIESSDLVVITNVAIALAEVVLAAMNALCAFPDALAAVQQIVAIGGPSAAASPLTSSAASPSAASPSHHASSPAAQHGLYAAGAGHIFSCRHCGMPTHVRLPDDLPSGKALTKEERDAEAAEGAIVSSRTYAVCPQGLVLPTAGGADSISGGGPDPLLQSWYVHQHMHPRPE